MRIKINQSIQDVEIRKYVLDLLNNARSEIIIATGEWSAFDYLELRNAVKEALKRGITIKVYGTGIPPHRVNVGLKYGCKIYFGQKGVSPHFVIADGKNGVISEKHVPEKRGERWGTYYKDEPKILKNKIDVFSKLLKEAKAAKPLAYEDTLLRTIEEPLDFGVETDSSKIDAIIYS